MNDTDKKEMIRSLQEFVIPALRKLNFKGSFPHFKRITIDRINLLTFQFDKRGGGFVIEIANCKTEGFTTSWGLEIKTNKLNVFDLNKRKRIQSNMKTENSATEDWFRYDKKQTYGNNNVYRNICDEVLSKFDIAEDYWKNGELN
jgi:hypothetical protein